MTRLRASSHVRTLGEATPVVTLLARRSVTGKTATQMRAEEQARADAQPMRVRCEHCDWSDDGLAGEVREAFRHHLAEEHADVVRRLPRRQRYLTLVERTSLARARERGEKKRA